MIGAVVAGTVTASTVIYSILKKRELAVVKKFRVALKQYISDVRNGKLDITSINHLMDSLEYLKQNKDYEKIKIELTTEELNVLVNRIYEYTLKLAKDNEVELQKMRLAKLTILSLVYINI